MCIVCHLRSSFPRGLRDGRSFSQNNMPPVTSDSSRVSFLVRQSVLHLNNQGVKKGRLSGSWLVRSTPERAVRVPSCDGLASRPGEVEILLAASCYRNRDKLRQLWASLSSKASHKKGNSHRFFVMISWTRTGSVWAIPQYGCLSGNSFNDSQFPSNV